MQSVPKIKVDGDDDKLSAEEDFSAYLSRNRRMSRTPTPRRESVISTEDKNMPTFHIYKYNKDTTFETGEGLCGKCKKVVYAAEKVWGPGENIPWHKDCLRCQTCHKHLEPGNMEEFEGEPYCSSCYNKEHAPLGI